jgi:hypothetical protein
VTPEGNPAPPALAPAATLDSTPFAVTLPGAPGVPAAWHGLEAFSAPPTALPPPEAAPPPAVTVPWGMFELRGVHGPLDVAVCTAAQLWDTLVSLPAQTASGVSVACPGVEAVPLLRLAVHLQLDHLVPPPPLPVPPPREVPLELNGLHQAFARLLNNRATGMLRLRPDDGAAVGVFVQGGMVQYVHHPGAVPPLPAFLVAPGSDNMRQLLTDVITRDTGALQALLASGTLLEADAASRVVAFVYERMTVVFGVGRWHVSFVPHVSAPYALPPGTLPATSWG